MTEPIPQGWKKEPLRNLAQIVSGGTPSRNVPEFWSPGTIPWVTPTDITESSGRYLLEVREHISELGLASCSAKVLPSGSLLMTSRATLGEVRIAVGEVCTNQGFKSLIPVKGVDGRFLFYQIGLNKERYKGLGIGSTFLEVNKRDTERFEVLVAPEREQRRIAEILSTLDEAIEQTESLIAKHQQIKAGLMHDLFTRGVTPDGHLRPAREQAPDLYKESPLGWIPKEWEVVPLGGLVRELVAGVSVNSTDIPAGADQIGVLKTSCVGGGSFDPAENKTVVREEIARACVSPRRDTILISRMNTPSLVGESGYVPDDFPNLFLPDRLWMTILDESSGVCCLWLAKLIQWREVREKITGLATGTSGSMKNISKSKLMMLKLATPKPEEQVAISARLGAIDDQLKADEEMLAKLCQQKNGLMHDLLTGRVRVPAIKAKEVSTMAHTSSDLEPNT